LNLLQAKSEHDFSVHKRINQGEQILCQTKLAM